MLNRPRAAAVLLLLALAAPAAGDEPRAGDPDPAELVNRLGAARYADREAASAAIEALGPDVLPALRAAVDDPDAEVRRRAGELARKIEITWMVDVREVLEWLPADTELIVVARGPFAADAQRQPEDSPITQFFQLQACGVTLDSRLWMRLQGALPQAPVMLAVEGSRRFRGRIGPLGDQYEGCHLLRFREPVGPAPGEPDVSLAAAAERVELIGGHSVFVFEPPNLGRFRLPQPLQPELARSLFVAWVRPDALAIASDRAQLAEVLARVRAHGEGEADASPSPRALPDDLPEWAHVVPTAPAWALRHFTSDRDDPTSPRHWSVNGQRYNRDPGAVGLVAWVDPAGKAVEARYLTDHPGGIAAVRPFWTSRLEQAEVAQDSPETVAIRLPAADTREAILAWFTISTALGHPTAERW